MYTPGSSCTTHSALGVCALGPFGNTRLATLLSDSLSGVIMFVIWLSFKEWFGILLVVPVQNSALELSLWPSCPLCTNCFNCEDNYRQHQRQQLIKGHRTRQINKWMLQISNEEQTIYNMNLTISENSSLLSKSIRVTNYMWSLHQKYKVKFTTCPLSLKIFLKTMHSWLPNVGYLFQGRYVLLFLFSILD